MWTKVHAGSIPVPRTARKIPGTLSSRRRGGNVNLDTPCTARLPSSDYFTAAQSLDLAINSGGLPSPHGL